jgi:hypothetical protein
MTEQSSNNPAEILQASTCWTWPAALALWLAASRH